METLIGWRRSWSGLVNKNPPGVGHHARGARHAISPERPPREGGSSPPNVIPLSSHRDRESCARRPTHGA
jgi:hypothetical protein